MWTNVVFLVLVVAATDVVGEGQPVNITPTLVMPPVSGRESFRDYCAPCHGRDARGTGPAASALKVPPANLTQLAASNRGQFPAERVRRLISDGLPDAQGHGSAEMPVWGPAFRSLDPSDKVAATRLDNLVAYLKSIQTK